MSKWKATMPRVNPAPGLVQMVVAAKNERGARAEFYCEVSDMKSKLIMKLMSMTDKQIMEEMERAA